MFLNYAKIKRLLNISLNMIVKHILVSDIHNWYVLASSFLFYFFCYAMYAIACFHVSRWHISYVLELCKKNRSLSIVQIWWLSIYLADIDILHMLSLAAFHFFFFCLLCSMRAKLAFLSATNILGMFLNSTIRKDH